MPGTYALTTVAKVKQFITGASASDDALLDRLIDVATAQLETYCDRQFKSRSQTEWLDGSGTRELQVPNYPVTAISRVCIGQRAVMSLTNSSSDHAYATVANDGTTLALAVVGGTNAGTDSLTLATYTTVALLVDAINAAGNGWAASVYDSKDNVASSDLRVFTARGVEDETLYLYAPEEPLADYVWDQNSGRVFRASAWPKGANNIYVAYTGGYSTVPDDLEQLCIELVVRAFQGRAHDTSLASERLGDYSYSLRSEVDNSAYMQRRLMPYRRVTV